MQEQQPQCVVFNLTFSMAVQCFWILVLLLVLYLMLNNIRKLRQDNTALRRSLSSRAIQDERDELITNGVDRDEDDDDHDS